MTKRFKILGMTLAASMAMAAPFAVQAAELSAESAGPTGLTTLVLEVTARELKGSGTSIRLNSGQTLTRTALKLAAGKIDVGIVPPGAFRAMQVGKGPYKDNPEQAIELSANLRSLYAFIGGSAHGIVRANSGIESWADVAGKRVYIGPPGGAANRQISGFVEQMSGFKPDADYKTIKMNWGASIPAFQDGQFDVLNFSTAVGSAALVQLFLQGDYRLLPATEGVIESAAYADFLAGSGSVKGGIVANSYEGVENGDIDVNSYAYTMLTAVNKDMSDDEAYLLTATFWDNLEDSKAEIAILKSVEDAPFLGNNMLLHPGAIRYYKEKGLDIPKELTSN